MACHGAREALARLRALLLLLRPHQPLELTVDGESDMLAHTADDHTKMVFDPTLRGKTDQFVVRLRKPK